MQAADKLPGSSALTADSLLKAMREGTAQLVEALQEDSSAIDVAVDNPIIGSGSLLVQAAHEGNHAAVDALARHGADLTCTSSKQVNNAVDWLSWHEGEAVAGTLDFLLSEWVSRFGAEETKKMLDTPRHLKRTPLLNAALSGNVQAAELLVKKYGADASICDEHGSSPLDLAAQAGGSKGRLLVQLLLEAGADPNVGNFGALFLAAQANDEASVKLLLQAGAKVNGLHEGEEGFTTPIECAARFGFLRVLKLLLGAEGAPRGEALSSALRYARASKQCDVERHLIKLGAAPGERAVGTQVAFERWALPGGLVPGRATAAEEEARAAETPEGEEASAVAVEEVEGAYRVRWSGRANQTVCAATPVVLSAEHREAYFEVEVEEMGLLVAVGFAREGGVKRFSLPGWEAGTYGVHSDDGLLQSGGAGETKVMKGWAVKAGSTVGMGVEWNDAAAEYHLFVTLDGARQPRTVPLSDDADDVFTLYPIVGADPRGSSAVVVNLGGRPFVVQDGNFAAAVQARRAAQQAAAAAAPTQR